MASFKLPLWLGIAWLAAASSAMAQGVADLVVVRGAAVADGKPLAAGGSIAADTTLVVLFEADALSANKAVGVRILGDTGRHGPLPVLETVVTFPKSTSADLSLTLQRGVVVLTNLKKAGAAKVHLQVGSEIVEVLLQEPGTKLGVETYGRHAPGFASNKKDNPTKFVFALLIEGKAILSCDNKRIAMAAPPGPAMFRWDSQLKSPEVEQIDKLPQEFFRDLEGKKRFAQMCKAAAGLGDKEGSMRIASLMKSKDPIEREVAVTAAGAFDDLPRLLEALKDDKNADVRQQAVLVLRHWLGRGPGQVKTLVKAAADLGYPKASGKTVVHLLFGFDAHERSQPQTYELLIEDLKHKQLAVRELAQWHLVRLAPAGKDIAFDAAAPEATRQAAIAQWEKLIPAGKLPPAPEAK